MMINFSGSEGCIEVRCAVKYSQSFLASCCTFIWQLAALLLIDNFKPGYIEKDEVLIVGLQSDAPLKRIMNPYGGFRMVKNALDAYGLKMDSANHWLCFW